MTALPAWVGCWRRRSLTLPGQPVDRTTDVTWLQASRLFVDLRIPAGRPDFSACKSLDDCTSEQLRWLATQQGFAGHLEVYGDVYRWHRHLDLQPAQSVPDAGRMTQCRDGWTEIGIFTDYAEEWAHVAHRGGVCAATKFIFASGASARPWREGIVVVVDDVFMLAIERSLAPDYATRLSEAFEQHDSTALREVLDGEISYGRYDRARGCAMITRSSLPFREGLRLSAATGAAESMVEFMGSHPTLAGRELRWATGANALC